MQPCQVAQCATPRTVTPQTRQDLHLNTGSAERTCCMATMADCYCCDGLMSACTVGYEVQSAGRVTPCKLSLTLSTACAMANMAAISAAPSVAPSSLPATGGTQLCFCLTSSSLQPSDINQLATLLGGKAGASPPIHEVRALDNDM